MFNSNCSPGLDRLRTIKFLQIRVFKGLWWWLFTLSPMLFLDYVSSYGQRQELKQMKGNMMGGEGEKDTGIHRRGMNMTAGCRAMDQWQIKQTVPQKD